ncbi:hypothetical protein NDU88_001252 [Pleurodeles waltl]|uniref:Uncharacterized protein n=1 Tax=Pleurodeles waltl TaxID=8319 RepID=A0AAV7V7P8_PLEWA|nr:hypothetical protein NDU88_001252 [Pleurodeles waltl]
MNEDDYHQDSGIHVGRDREVVFQFSKFIPVKEVEVAIKQSQCRKATGLDGVPADLFRDNLDLWAPVLANVFRAAIIGQLPSTWKEAIGVPIFKQDSCTANQEELWRRVNTLEEQHIELQVKQEDSENWGCRNNLHIRGIPCGAESEDIMSITRDLQGCIRGTLEGCPLVHNRVQGVAAMPGRLDATPNILTRVHLFQEKEAELKAAWRESRLVCLWAHLADLPKPFSFDFEKEKRL